MKNLLIVLIISSFCFSLEIRQMPISFSEKRIELTKEYIKNRYDLEVNNINIIPKMIVVHHTGINSLEKSFERLNSEILFTDRKYIKKVSTLNVSAHFLVDTDGTIYSLMPETYMARHVIGLNYSSIGIENVGGQNKDIDLTKEQLDSNIKLIKYLKNKYKTIEYLIGHYEYKDFSNHYLFLEKDKNYRTRKSDPSVSFMEKLREVFTKLKAS